MKKIPPKNGDENAAFAQDLAENWASLVRRSAKATVRRAVAEREERWNRRFAALNRGLLATGLALVAAFPFACAKLQELERVANEYALQTARRTLDDDSPTAIINAPKINLNTKKQ